MNPLDIVCPACGDLAGTSVDTPHGPVRRFAGIPFGAPPVGDRRFRAAEPVPRWEGVRNADEFGPSPVQAVEGPFSDAVPGMKVAAVDEDCLSLNVWTPAAADHFDGAPLPVMMWVYGGAFVIGGGAQPTYDGARLAAEQNVVVVTMNYRVGAFGFLDLRSVPGGESTDTNCGTHDLVLALQWIADNIAAFGGDRHRVTVFGESAGGGSIMHLLTTPRIGELVAGAIAQSPGIDFTQNAALSAEVTATFLKHAGASTVDELRALPAARVLDAQVATSNDLLLSLGTMVFHPVVDDIFVTATPSVALAGGAASDVALLIGYNADEMRLFPDPRADALDDSEMARWLRQYLTTRMGREPDAGVAETMVADYRSLQEGTTRRNGSDVWGAIQTDGIMRQPPIRVADSRIGPAPTYVYQFNWQSRMDGRDAGAFHALDLPFVFDTFDVDGWGDFIGADEEARDIAVKMRTAWASFAARSDPSSALVGRWPPYSIETRRTMVFDTPCRVVADPLREQRTWWDGLWDAEGCRPAGVPF